MFCSTKIVNNTTSSANGSVSLNETLILNEKRVGTLNGMISFFNSDGYLSGDSFYALQVFNLNYSVIPVPLPDLLYLRFILVLQVHHLLLGLIAVPNPNFNYSSNYNI